MDGADHVIFNVTITTAVTSNPVVILGSLIGSVLSDIDEPTSYIGQLIGIKTKHRGFAHSVVFAGLLYYVVARLTTEEVGRGLAFGILTHEFGDLLCGGVQLFWPFKTRVRLLSLKSDGRLVKLCNLFVVAEEIFRRVT